jgi:hypothetical protein
MHGIPSPACTPSKKRRMLEFDATLENDEFQV